MQSGRIACLCCVDRLPENPWARAVRCLLLAQAEAFAFLARKHQASGYREASQQSRNREIILKQLAECVQGCNLNIGRNDHCSCGNTPTLQLDYPMEGDTTSADEERITANRDASIQTIRPYPRQKNQHDGVRMKQCELRVRVCDWRRLPANEGIRSDMGQSANFVWQMRVYTVGAVLGLLSDEEGNKIVARLYCKGYPRKNYNGELIGKPLGGYSVNGRYTIIASATNNLGQTLRKTSEVESIFSNANHRYERPIFLIHHAELLEWGAECQEISVTCEVVEIP